MAVSRSLVMMVVMVMVALPALVDAARILALLGIPSRSHHIWNRSLMLELASRGHQVTVFSADPEKQPTPNLTDVVIEDMYAWESAPPEGFSFNDLRAQSKLESVRTGFEWGVQTCNQILQSRGAKQLADMAAHGVVFDLVIVEIVFQDCVYGFIDKFGDPLVMAVTAFGVPPWTHHVVGNEVNPSYVNTFDLPMPARMNFLQRATNALYHWYTLWYRELVYLPQVEAINREFFGSSVSTVPELERKVSLVLVNAHFSIDYPQPLVPALIPVAGMHIKKPKPLPEDLRKFMDEAPSGVIFFSLGTNVRSDRLGERVLTELLEAFAQVPQRVLWKFESETLQGVPANVKISKWLPQNDILAHPNVVAFISHCGLLSSQEAVYHGVPIVGIPFFADQTSNAEKLELRGVALQLNILTMTKSDVLTVLREITTNQSFRQNMRNLSAIFRDQPESPLDRAMYWTEYVLRHGGARHLRSAAMDLSWYQRLLLDVIAALLSALVVLTTVSCLLIKMAFKRFQGKKQKQS